MPPALWHKKAVPRKVMTMRARQRPVLTMPRCECRSQRCYRTASLPVLRLKRSARTQLLRRALGQHAAASCPPPPASASRSAIREEPLRRTPEQQTRQTPWSLRQAARRAARWLLSRSGCVWGRCRPKHTLAPTHPAQASESRVAQRAGPASAAQPRKESALKEACAPLETLRRVRAHASACAPQGERRGCEGNPRQPSRCRSYCSKARGW